MNTTHPQPPARLPRALAVWTLALSVTLTGAGCQTLGPLQPGGGTPAQPVSAAEQQMLDDEKRFNDTVIGGVLTGAAVGAAAGGLIGILRGDKKKDVIKKVGVGAAVGATAGGIDGYMTAKREQAGNNEVRALQAAAADVRQDNEKLQAYLASSGAVLREGQARLTTLRADLAAKRVSTEQAQQARLREERNITSMNAALGQAKQTRDQYKQAAAQFTGSAQSKRDLDAEIKRMDAQVAQLEKHIGDYNQALSVSRA